jgi:hypothetical protein
LPSEFFHTKNISRGGSTKVKIESKQPVISYYYSLHPEERGLIVILPKDEDDMFNTQRLKFLNSIDPSLSI